MAWKDLSIQDKSRLMGIFLEGGVSSLSDMRRMYDEGGDKPNFVKRLEDPNRATIKDWANTSKVATHKMGYATVDNGQAIVYPEVQEINGRLVDFTRPPFASNAGIESAIERRDTLMMPESKAAYWTEHYKELYPGFNKYEDGGEEILAFPQPNNTPQINISSDQIRSSISKEARKAAVPLSHGIENSSSRLPDKYVQEAIDSDPIGSYSALVEGKYMPSLSPEEDLRRRSLMVGWRSDYTVPFDDIDYLYQTLGHNNEVGYTELGSPARLRKNDSPTSSRSAALERQYASRLRIHKDAPYIITYSPEGEFYVKGVGYVSPNVLNGLAEAASKANVPVEEVLGLSALETGFGNYPNFSSKNDIRDYLNMQYARNFGALPNWAYVNGYVGSKRGWDNTKYDVDGYFSDEKDPLVYALKAYSKGLYNTGDPQHTAKVKAKVAELLKDKNIKNWLDSNKKDEGGPLLHQYIEGGDTNKLISSGNEYVDYGMNLLPIVGTAMDIEEAWRNPSLSNIGWAALGLGADLLSFGTAGSIVRGAKTTAKLAKAAKVAEATRQAKIASALKHGNSAGIAHLKAARKAHTASIAARKGAVKAGVGTAVVSADLGKDAL